MGNNKVLATVHGKEITQNDLESLFQSLNPQTAAQFSSEEGKKNLLQELINQELIYLDAVENDIENEEAFQSEFEKMKAGFLKQYAINQLLGSVTVSEQECADFYNQNQSQFVSPDSIRASHILVETEDKAQDILNKINEGLSFSDAAQEYPTAQSYPNH